ncbi:MAG: efflux RND transporter periplasmic adaptor subunit [Paludibacter sp.]
MKYIIIFAITGFLFSCTPNKPTENSHTPRLSVITLQEDSITLYAEFPARIEGKVNVNIRSQVDGYIREIFVEEGAYVKAGQPLFKIDDRSYVEQVNTASANLDAALAARKNAKLEVEKYTLLSQNSVTSDFQLRTAKAQYETAQANVAQQRAGLEASRINLGFTLIKSPVNGFIGRIPKRIGNLASASDTQPLTTLSEISNVYAYFSMTEKEFLRFNARYKGNNLNQKISETDSVSLKLADDSDYPYRGKIQMINGEFEAGTGAMSVHASFKNPRYLLRTGNTGRIILPYTEKKVLLIPVLSTLDIQDKIFVVRLNKENKSERVAITVSHKQGDYYIVKSGLHSGDRIVSSDLETIEEGSIIQPK